MTVPVLCAFSVRKNLPEAIHFLQLELTKLDGISIQQLKKAIMTNTEQVKLSTAINPHDAHALDIQ